MSFYNPYLCGAPQSDGEIRLAVALGFLSTHFALRCVEFYIDNTLGPLVKSFRYFSHKTQINSSLLPVLDYGRRMEGLLKGALNVDALSRSLETRYFGRGDRLSYLPTVESTNTLAMHLARERPDEGLVVLTDNQTAGKGRQGRRWVDVPGCNVLMSITLRPSFPPHLLVMLASLAVVDAIAGVCKTQAAIKWPNDVLIEERKVAGILIETSHDAQGQLIAVAGIGINVNGHIEEVTRYLAEKASLVTRATTLETACGHPVNREVLIASLLRSLEEVYLSLQQETTGVLSTTANQTLPSRLLWEKWRDRLATLGRTITVRQGNSTISGIAEDVDGNGELLLRDHSGELICITWGSVEYPTG